MSLYDMYINNVRRKSEEIAKLQENIARENKNLTTQIGKIANASRSISNTNNQSTIKSKLSEIQRAEDEKVRIFKKIADLESKIATKTKEKINEENKARKEFDKIQKKKLDDEKKQIQSYNRQITQVNHNLYNQSIAHNRLANEVEKLKQLPETITVLFLASNAVIGAHLKLDEEARAIQEMISKSKHRDSVIFETRWAVRPLDILQAINELNPTIIHFSGHGAESSDLVLQNPDGTVKLVTKEAITQTITTSSDNIKLVFFNTCFSSEQADCIIKHIDVAIGMTNSIGDEAARIFSAQFYSALGFGLSVNRAFQQGKSAIMLENIREENTPQLYVKDGIDPNKLILVSTN